MVIDFHTHTFPDFLAPKVIPKLEKGANIKAFVDGTTEGLRKSMLEAKVDMSVLLPVATTISQVETCNNCAQITNQNSEGEFFSFGAMHPDYENYKAELIRVRDMGLKGIKLHPDYQATFLDDMKYKKIIDYASELGLITIVHTGIDIGLPGPVHAMPQIIKNLISDVHPQKLVLAHMGGFHVWEEAMELLAGENVYLDTAFSLGEINYAEALPKDERAYSMMQEELFMQMLDVFGEDKILFATDSPWGGQKETLKAFRILPLSEVQRSKILSENAMSLLNIHNGQKYSKINK